MKSEHCCILVWPLDVMIEDDIDFRTGDVKRISEEILFLEQILCSDCTNFYTDTSRLK